MDKSHFQAWTDELVKSFKVNSLEDLKGLFEVYKSDHMDFNSLELSNNVYAIDSFPRTCEFVRFSGEAGQTETGVARYFAEREEQGQEIIVTDPNQDLWTDDGVINVLTYLEKIDFDTNNAGFNELLQTYTPLIDLTLIHNAGGSPVDEIEVAIKTLFELKLSRPLILKVAHDGQLFMQVAKLRALKFILDKLKDQKNLPSYEIISTSSLCMHSHFESSTNMLRNVVTCTAGFMGGSDYIALDNHIDPDQALYWRQTRNTFFVLNEESHLGKVSDPARGSRLIESVTEFLIKNSYASYESVEDKGFNDYLKGKAHKAFKQFENKRNEVETGRKVLVGVNNYADPTEVVGEISDRSTSVLFPIRSPHARLENLRKNAHGQSCRIGLRSFGELKSVFDRVNFAQNFFEVVGKPLEHVHSDEFELKLNNESALVLCAQDDTYEDLLKNVNLPDSIPVFIVSREFSQEGCFNLHKGLNMFDVFTKQLGLKEEL